MALSVSKINNKTGFKDELISKLTSYCPKKKKVEYLGMHVEIVKIQQVKVKRVISIILASKIPQ